MKTTVLSMIFWAMASGGFAGENAVETQAKGQGATRDLAIQNALYQAVSQVQGVKVTSGMASVGIDTAHVDIERDPASSRRTSVTGPFGSTTEEVNGLPSKVDAIGTSTSTLTPLTLTEAKGLVKSYEVVSEQEVSAKVYEVTLKVWVYDYQSPEDTRKIRLAIFPFESTTETHHFGPVSVSGKRLGEQFSQYLNSMLGRNEKYTLLDRNAQTAIFKEKQILLSDDAPIEEKVRLGEVLGADYMLVGTIPQAEIIVKERMNPAIGYPTREFDAYMEVEYRLIVGPTRQVAASDQLRFKLEDREVKALVEKWESDNIDYGQLQQALVMRAAKQIADMVTDTLYPIRIAMVQENGMLVLNQGGKRFAEGDILEVNKIGQDILDPETGKSLGKAETQLGMVKVTKILPRFSYATLIQGTATIELSGGICHRIRTEDNRLPEPPSRPSNIKETPSGGVKLPNDDRQPSQLMRNK